MCSNVSLTLFCWNGYGTNLNQTLTPLSARVIVTFSCKNASFCFIFPKFYNNLFIFFCILHPADLTLRTSHANDANDATFLPYTTILFAIFSQLVNSQTLSVCGNGRDLGMWKRGESMFLPTCCLIARRYKFNSLSCGTANAWWPLPEMVRLIWRAA